MVAEWIACGTLNLHVMGLVSVLPVGWLCNILRQDENSMHCYQLAWEQLEFGAGPAWDVQHQSGSFPRDGSFLLGLK